MKRIPQAPLTGFLNFRDDPSQLKPSEFIWRENFYTKAAGKLFRLFGFEKFMSGWSYGNQDLHDQLLPLQKFYNYTTPFNPSSEGVTSWPDSSLCSGSIQTRDNGREPFTFGLEVVTSAGSRHLLAGTQSRLYSFNATAKNWKIIGDGFGGAFNSSGAVRWKGATLFDTTVLVNDFDEPQYWTPSAEPHGCLMRSTSAIPDLRLIGISSAAVVVKFSNAMFLMNVTMNGRRYANRWVASDLSNPLSYDPAKADSITAYGTLPNSDGETILAAEEISGGDLVVYTDKGIYVGRATGDADNPWNFREHYKARKDENRCLYYPNTLMSLGSEHIYLGDRGIYVFTPYRTEPEEIDWMALFSSVVFNGAGSYLPIASSSCGQPVTGLRKNQDGSTDIYISYPESNSVYNSKTIILNKERQFASTMDCGFTMFVSHQPDSRPSFRDWLLSMCTCSLTGLESLGITLNKEPFPATTCSGIAPGSVWTGESGTIFGIETEDFTRAETDINSLCTKLSGVFLDEICKECNSGRLFIGALSTDWCLKQIGTAFSREVCSNVLSGEGTVDADGFYHSFDGTYLVGGYYSTLRSAPNRFGSEDLKKSVNAIILEVDAVDQVYPCVVQVRVGYSRGARDANKSDCSITWSLPTRRYLECPNTMTDAEYAALKLLPPEGLVFPVSGSGMYLYYEIKIANLNTQADLDSSLIPALGGDACFGQLTSQMRTDSPQIIT